MPLQARALDARDRLPSGVSGERLFSAPQGGYLDLRNFRSRDWKPAQ